MKFIPLVTVPKVKILLNLDNVSCIEIEELYSQNAFNIEVRFTDRGCQTFLLSKDEYSELMDFIFPLDA